LAFIIINLFIMALEDGSGGEVVDDGGDGLDAMSSGGSEAEVPGASGLHEQLVSSLRAEESDRVGVDELTEENALSVLKDKMNADQYEKLVAVNNPKLHLFIAEHILRCNPAKIFVSDGSEKDVATLRQRALDNGEERALVKPGHTVHFDGINDQARDRAMTKFLVEKGDELPGLNTMPKGEGLGEIEGIMEGIMNGKELYICFHCLGPTNSEFSLPSVQLTDSAYVAHSLSLLYRQGYDEFQRQADDSKKDNERFLRIVHSAGELDEDKTSANVDDRRVYIDRENSTVYVANTQYAGNTVGMKKLAMRLAMFLGDKEGWLTEHMNLFGVRGKGQDGEDRVTYFSGAFPSACGKTATAMLPFGDGEGNGGMIGDDIVYIRVLDRGDGRKVLVAVNVENGMFGIVKDVNAKDDPAIWEAINEGGQVIFSNLLVTEEGEVRWIGDEKGPYPSGQNYSGEWVPVNDGVPDEDGNVVDSQGNPPSHKNARFTLPLSELSDMDGNSDNPQGVEVGAMVYGGRDRDTWMPVCEAFDWKHGIINKAAALESETTSATLGAEGVRKPSPMANLDFLSLSMGRYVENNLRIADGEVESPKIFGVNYFLRDEEGDFLNGKNDKVVWYAWMERRVHGEVDVIETPIGFIPKYEDLVPLFQEHLGQDFTKELYDELFQVRVSENLAKIARAEVYFSDKGDDIPKVLFEQLAAERRRLEAAREQHGDYISPDVFAEAA